MLLLIRLQFSYLNLAFKVLKYLKKALLYLSYLCYHQNPIMEKWWLIESTDSFSLGWGSNPLDVHFLEFEWVGLSAAQILKPLAQIFLLFTRPNFETARPNFLLSASPKFETARPNFHLIPSGGSPKPGPILRLFGSIRYSSGLIMV